MKAFKFYRRYWAAIGGGLFVALAFFIGLWGQNLPDLQRFMVLMFLQSGTASHPFSETPNRKISWESLSDVTL